MDCPRLNPFDSCPCSMWKKRLARQSKSIAIRTSQQIGSATPSAGVVIDGRSVAIPSYHGETIFNVSVRGLWTGFREISSWAVFLRPSRLVDNRGVRRLGFSLRPSLCYLIRPPVISGKNALPVWAWSTIVWRLPRMLPQPRARSLAQPPAHVLPLSVRGVATVP